MDLAGKGAHANALEFATVDEDVVYQSFQLEPQLNTITMAVEIVVAVLVKKDLKALYKKMCETIIAEVKAYL